MSKMNDKFILATPGINFDPDSGKLRIFRTGSIWVLIGWPFMMALKKTISNPAWTHVG